MKIVFVLLLTVLVMTRASRCLLEGSHCEKSRYPCCWVKFNGGITLGAEPIVCFRFGKRTCQGARKIKNFSLYLDLVKKLNGSNYKEISSQYWNSIRNPRYQNVLHLPHLSKSIINFIINLDGSKEIFDDELEDSDCIEQWGDCWGSDKPYCQRRIVPGGSSYPAEVLCFKFGDGVCKFSGHIRNVEEYIRLSRQLNKTNFLALSTQYWKSVHDRYYPRF